MKTKIDRKVTEDVEIRHVEILIPFDEIAEHAPTIPHGLQTTLRTADLEHWRLLVDIDTGQIENWPKDAGALDLYCCPKDGGTYRLLAPDGKAIAVIEQNYVPNDCIPGDSGDYIGLKIDKSGKIVNWPLQQDMDVAQFFPGDEDDD